MSNSAASNADVKITNIRKTFKINSETIEVLNNIDLNIKPGEFISIVGSSGCGKSTLLKIIVGLGKASSGEVTLDGQKVTKPTIECGMVFQEARLLPWLTVEQNIEFGISKKINMLEKKKLIADHIKLVGLKGFEKAIPSQLSGGMQQRVSIARALINRPGVLLLDEPFGALDALTRINMQNEILRIWETEKTTMILVTHDIDEAIYLGDRVVVMSSRPGTIKKIVPVELARPRDRTNPDFFSIRKKIYAEFFGSTEITIEYNI